MWNRRSRRRSWEQSDKVLSFGPVEFAVGNSDGYKEQWCSSKFETADVLTVISHSFRWTKIQRIQSSTFKNRHVQSNAVSAMTQR